MEGKTLLILVLVVFVYALIGGAIMMALEKSNEDTQTTDISALISSFLTDNSACVSSSELQSFLVQVREAYDSGVLTANGTTSTDSNWDFGNSIFFVMTAITTIGYGNQTPQTSGGRAFIVIFAIVGIPITAVMILGLAEKLHKLVHFIENKTLPCLEKHQKAERIIKMVMIQLLVLTLLLFIPSAIFYAIEEWTYGEALYYCVITFTTIGFGDFVAGGGSDGSTRVVYKLAVVVWIFIGLAWIGSVISGATEKYKEMVDKQEKDKDKKDGKEKEKEKDEEKLQTTPAVLP